MRKITSAFLATIQLQLFLNIISLMIIAHWGLPLSWVAPLSNIIFSPFLSAFLLLSSLIFFFELLHLPNGGLIYFLELLTDWWSKIMSLANRSLILNVSKPSIFFTLAIAISTFAILQSKHLQRPMRRIVSFSIILSVMLIYLGYMQLPQHDIKVVPIGKKSLTIVYTQGKICLIDKGALAQSGCTKGWIEFTLLPLLRQTYATDMIEHLFAPRPTIKTFQSISDLCATTTIKNVYIPYWQGDTPRNLARAYFTTRTSIEKNGKLHRIGNKNAFIILNTASRIELIPLERINSYQTIHFPDIEVRCILANEKHQPGNVTTKIT